MNCKNVMAAAFCIAFLSGVASIGLCGEKTPPSPGPATSMMVEADVALNAMTAIVEGRMKNVEDILGILSLTDAVKSGEWKKMKPLLEASEKQGLPALLWYARPDGSYFTVEKDLTDQNLKDRDYFPKVLSGKKVKGALVVSHSTGKKVAVVAVPVKEKGRVKAVLGASVFLEKLNQIVKNDLELPGDMLFFVLDKKGETILNWKDERIFAYPTKQESKSMVLAVKEMLEKGKGWVEYDYHSKRRRMIYQTSSETGWIFSIGKFVEEKKPKKKK